MAYSIWFQLKKGVSVQTQNSLLDLTNSKFLKNHGRDRFEFKAENHFLAFPHEAISEEFCRQVRPYIKEISLSTWDGNLPSICPLTWKFGANILSFDNKYVLIKGKRLPEIIKMYNLFMKSNGDIERFKYHKSEIGTLRLWLDKFGQTIRILQQNLEAATSMIEILTKANIDSADARIERDVLTIQNYELLKGVTLKNLIRKWFNYFE